MVVAFLSQYVIQAIKRMSYPGDTVEVAMKISALLDCGIDKKVMAIAISLIDYGISPEAVAHIVSELPSSIQRRRLRLLV